MGYEDEGTTGGVLERLQHRRANKAQSSNETQTTAAVSPNNYDSAGPSSGRAINPSSQSSFSSTDYQAPNVSNYVALENASTADRSNKNFGAKGFDYQAKGRGERNFQANGNGDYKPGRDFRAVSAGNSSSVREHEAERYAHPPAPSPKPNSRR